MEITNREIEIEKTSNLLNVLCFKEFTSSAVIKFACNKSLRFPPIATTNRPSAFYDSVMFFAVFLKDSIPTLKSFMRPCMNASYRTVSVFMVAYIGIHSFSSSSKSTPNSTNILWAFSLMTASLFAMSFSSERFASSLPSSNSSMIL